MVFKKKKTALDSANSKNTDAVVDQNLEKVSLLKELQDLDVKNYGEWSRPVQSITWCLLGLVIVGVGYLAFIQPVQSNIAITQMDRDILIADLQKKKNEVSGLEQYKLQAEEMERRFNIQLEQLPKESEIPGLVDDIHRAGVASGLDLQNLELRSEEPKEFFIEQPISITAAGQFHNFGDFVMAVSALPRIVTVQDFNIGIDDKTNSANVFKIPKLKYAINAKTYRYLENVPAAQTKDQQAAQ